MAPTKTFLFWSAALTVLAAAAGLWMTHLSSTASGRPDAGILVACAIAASRVVTAAAWRLFSKGRVSGLIQGVVGGMTLGNLALVGLRVAPQQPLYLVAGMVIMVATALVVFFTDLDDRIPGRTLFAVALGQLLLFMAVF